MNKWILILLLIAVGAFGFWKVDPLGMWQQEVSSDLLEYVPADTVFYMGGRTDEATANFMSGYTLLASSPSQDVAIQELMSEFLDGDSGFSKFVEYIADGYESTDGSYGSFTEYLGLSLAGEYAFYAHGAIPVLRTPLQNLEKFNSVVDGASQEAGWAYEEKTIGNANAKIWALGDKDEDGIEMSLVIATVDNAMIATLIADSDDEKRVLERLGQSAVSNSLAQSGELGSLMKEYSFSNDMLMFINFERLFGGLLKPESNSFGQDILRYLPEEEAASFKEKVTAECVTDYIGLAGTMPRLIGGYTQLDVKGQSMSMDYQMLLEIKNKLVTGELAKMRGHIPNYALESDDKFASFGIGFDVDKMTPALTALWTAFTNAEFSCASLVEAQEAARGSSPAMLGMATGMAQGVKGFGLSLFDFNWDTSSQMPGDVNAIASISAENPQSILSLTQMLPMVSGLEIATDGTPTKIDLPMLPPNIEVFAAVKGKHIALYTGDQGEKAANSLSSENLDPNGMYSVGFNYRKLAEFGSALDDGAFGSGKACLDQYEFLHMMNAYQMDFNVLFDISDKGMDTRVSGSIDIPKAASELNVAGDWQVEYLNEDCKWEVVGVDKLNDSGTGEYHEQDEEGQCRLYQITYDWERKGNSVVMTGTGKENIRDTCDDAWEEEDPEEYTCHIINATGDTFQCFFDPGSEDAALYRYTRG